MNIDVDKTTYEALDLAARLTGMTHGHVIARLIQQTKLPSPTAEPDQGGSAGVGIHADYMGHRTNALFDPVTERVDIVGGPMDGEFYKSPTGAARAVVGHYNPTVSPHRNGWSFWVVSDGSGEFLQKIRRQA